jgi:hypothetical protein
VGTGLKPLLHYVKDFVPKALRKSTHIFLGGTAGFRVQDQKTQTRLLRSIYQYIKSSGFLCTPQHVQVLDGGTEAMYDFAAANIVMRTFEDESIRAVESFDIGGVSTQIGLSSSLRGDDAALGDVLPLRNVRLGQRDYLFYGHSFLGFGFDEAFYRAVELQTVGSDTSPCLLRGSRHQTNPQPGSKHHRSLIAGTGDKVECEAIVKRMLSEEVSQFQAGSHGVAQPFELHPHASFAAEAGKIVGFDNMNLIGHVLFRGNIPESVTLEEWESATKAICTLSGAELEASWQSWGGSEVKSSSESCHDSPICRKVKAACFGGIYMSVLLREMSAPGTVQLTISPKIAAFSLNWALGAVVLQLQDLSQAAESEKEQVNAKSSPGKDAQSAEQIYQRKVEALAHRKRVDESTSFGFMPRVDYGEIPSETTDIIARYIMMALMIPFAWFVWRTCQGTLSTGTIRHDLQD